MHHKDTQHPELGFLITFPNKRNQGSMEKWLILRPEKEIYKMNRGGASCSARK